jgi:hypothetical protein
MTQGTPMDPSGPAGRARGAAYREFMEPGELPEGARMAEAERVLGALLEQELGVPIDEVESEKPRTTAARPQHATHPPRRAPASPSRSRTMLGLAATVVVLAGATWLALNRPGREPMMRGGPPVGAPGSWDAKPSVEPTASGGVRLVWRSEPKATSYTVVFLSADLSELARVSARGDTSIVLEPTARPATLPAGAQGLWRVEAYAGRDELGRSPASPITFP